MTINDVLAQKGTQVFTINHEKLASDALRTFVKKHIGALVALDTKNNIMGIVTERDVLYMFASAAGKAKSARVKDIMTPAKKLIIGHKDNDLEYVMSIMTENRMRHMPIIDDKGKLAGFISIGDIVKALLKNAEYEKNVLTDYIQGTYPK